MSDDPRTGAGALRTVRFERAADPEAWRHEARRLLVEGVRPEAVVWCVDDGAPVDDLFAADGRIREPVPGAASGAPTPAPGTAPGSPASVPASFLELARHVVCHRDPQRFALLYRVLWRLAAGERRLLDDRTDADVHRLRAMAKAVTRDRHKMTAFVRFRLVPDVGHEHYAAWFEPEHRIVRLTADFFRRRFANQSFSIFTPDESVHWNRDALAFGPPATRHAVPADDALDPLWREYFANIFNPARLKLDAMRAEMPVKYWKNLPEAPLIADLVRDAGPRSAAMVRAPGTRAPRFAERAGLVPPTGEGGPTPDASYRTPEGGGGGNDGRESDGRESDGR